MSSTVQFSSAPPSRSQYTRPSPQKSLRATMLRQTYSLAHLARGKLTHEAARGDHDLRLLVGHANLLDSLMIELAEAEQEQESWFNASLQSATQSQKHMHWDNASVEGSEEEDEESTSSESESEDEEEQQLSAVTRVPVLMMEDEEEEEESEDDLEEDYESLSLTRTQSRSSLFSPPTSPPELSHDFEEDEESSEDDEFMPPSPSGLPASTYSEKERQAIVTTSFFDDGYYLPSRTTPELPATISAY